MPWTQGESPLIKQHRKQSKRPYLFAYTLLFTVTALLVYSFYWMAGKSFIWVVDGWDQHFKALVYYSQWLRAGARSLLVEHRLHFPTWDFALGQGADVLTTLHYYAIGDPLNLLSALVPTRWMVHFYDIMILLRIYLSGLFFSLYCFQMKKQNGMAVLAGALSYAFCDFVLFAGVQHPYFINPMMYLPLLLMGVEKVLAGKRPYLLIVIVAVAAVSNFYFFYVLVLLTVMYVAGRLISLYHGEWRQMGMPLLKIAGASALGVMMSAVLFLPVVGAFLSDARIAVDQNSILFYPLRQYAYMPAEFLAHTGVSGYTYTALGFSVLTFPAVMMLFRQKKTNTLLKVFFVIGIGCFLIPFAGKVFNGFSYATNRWCFGLAFLVAYILVTVWPSFVTMDKRDCRYLFVGLSVYLVVCLLIRYSRVTQAFIVLGVLFAMLVLWQQRTKQGAGLSDTAIQVVALAATLLSVVNNSFWLNAYSGSNYAARFVDQKDLMQNFSATAENAVKAVAKQKKVTDFYRYTGHELPWNTDLNQHLSSLQYYWSLSSPQISAFRWDMNMREYLLYRYHGLDERASLTTLASTRFFVKKEKSKDIVPYGFSKVGTRVVNRSAVQNALDAFAEEQGTDKPGAADTKRLQKKVEKRYTVYENDYALPLGYTYSRYLPQAEYQKLSSLQKQEAMLQGVVLDKAPQHCASVQPQLTAQEVPFTVSCNSKDVTQQGNSFVVTKKDSSITLKLEGLSASETYLSLRGLTYAGTSEYTLYNDDETIDPLNRYTQTDWDLLPYNDRKKLKDDHWYWHEPATLNIKISAAGRSNTLPLSTPEYTWFSGRQDFDVNLGYGEEGVSSIKITFPSIGIYRFNTMDVVCQPMDNYADQVNALKEDVLEQIKVDGDRVSGSIQLDTPKLLCLTIPYSKGWSATVDGQPAELLCANTMYMALELDAGQHTVQLHYQTPLLNAGMGVTAVGVLLFVAVIVVTERRKRRDA